MVSGSTIVENISHTGTELALESRRKGSNATSITILAVATC